MVGHKYYHLGKGSTLTSTGMVGHIYYHLRKGFALTSDHGRPSLPPCRKGSCVSVYSRLITSPWREPRSEVHQESLWSIQTSLWPFCSIESHQDWLRLRITCELCQDWLHPRTTYRTDYVWATYELRQDFMLRQPVSPAMLELITPSFERYRYGSHTGASLLLSHK